MLLTARTRSELCNSWMQACAPGFSRNLFFLTPFPCAACLTDNSMQMFTGMFIVSCCSHCRQCQECLWCCVQVAASRPSTYGSHAQLDMQLPAAQPAALPDLNQAAEQADDWAQFINMDAEADEDGQAQGQDDNDQAQNQQVTAGPCWSHVDLSLLQSNHLSFDLEYLLSWSAAGTSMACWLYSWNKWLQQGEWVALSRCCSSHISCGGH